MKGGESLQPANRYSLPLLKARRAVLAEHFLAGRVLLLSDLSLAQPNWNSSCHQQAQSHEIINTTGMARATQTTHSSLGPLRFESDRTAPGTAKHQQARGSSRIRIKTTFPEHSQAGIAPPLGILILRLLPPGTPHGPTYTGRIRPNAAAAAVITC